MARTIVTAKFREKDAKELVQSLFAASQWFEVTPLPDEA
jgi:hypothetical protein